MQHAMGRAGPGHGWAHRRRRFPTILRRRRGRVELLDRGVDAIFCANDATAAGALESIRARGLRAPEDVALAGFDDLDFAAELDPPLTTVRQGIRAQGAEAAHTLSQLLDDPDGGPRRVILPTELVIRRSTVGGVRAP